MVMPTSGFDPTQHPRGRPGNAGQFSTRPKAARDTTVTASLRGTVAVATPEAATGGICSSCGQATQRRSGLCRRCDPASRQNRRSQAATSSSPEQHTHHAAPNSQHQTGPIYDYTAEPVTADQIRCCAFKFVPDYRIGVPTGGFRNCKNAVIAPAEWCHRHGGAVETSLGRSVAKATAEAERGECYPLAAAHWESATARVEAAEGMLAEMLATDTSRLAEMMVEFRRVSAESSVGRMSAGNQVLILIQHWARAKTAGLNSDDALNKALELSAEPHMTAANWAKHGRTPLADMPDGVGSVGAVWFKPATDPKRNPDESDEEYEERRARSRRMWHGSVIEYPLSATEGTPYDVPKDAIGSFHPGGYGDPSAAIDTMTNLAVSSGINVEFTDRRPSSGAYAYWDASQDKIVVWNGVADGDRAAVAHSLAHELGHARLGHSTNDSAEHARPDKEAAAEAFAALVCAHHGIDTAELSAHYIADWRRSRNIDMRAGGLPAMRSAAKAYDEYVTATTPATPAEP